MDIYPVYLLKAVLAQDIDRMNNSVSTKLCPKTWLYVNLSVPRRRLIQKILSDGIELMMKETN